MLRRSNSSVSVSSSTAAKKSLLSRKAWAVRWLPSISGILRSGWQGHHDAVTRIGWNVIDMVLIDSCVFEPSLQGSRFDSNEIMRPGEFLRDTEAEPERKQFVVLLAGYVFGSYDGTAGTVIVVVKQ